MGRMAVFPVDMYTTKPYIADPMFWTTRERIQQLISYIANHLKTAKEVELWHIWAGGGSCAKLVDQARTLPKNQKLITKATTILCMSCFLENLMPLRTSLEHQVRKDRCLRSIF